MICRSTSPPAGPGCPAWEEVVVESRDIVSQADIACDLLLLAVVAVAVRAACRAFQPLAESRIVIMFKNFLIRISHDAHIAKIVIFIILMLHSPFLHPSSRDPVLSKSTAGAVTENEQERTFSSKCNTVSFTLSLLVNIDCLICLFN